MITRPEKSNHTSLSLKHGLQEEQAAAKQYGEYMKKIGHPVHVHESGLVVRPDLPFLGCTPDRKIVDPKLHPHYGLLEIKCPYTHRNITPLEAAKSDSGFCLSESNGILKLKESHQYFCQVQGQMAVCGAKWCDFVVYTFKGMHLERVLYNDAYWSEQLTNWKHSIFAILYHLFRNSHHEC